MVPGNYFILGLAQLSLGLDTSSGEFGYSDLRHYWPQTSASPLEDPASGAEAAGGNVYLHPSHDTSILGAQCKQRVLSFQSRHQLVGCATKDKSTLYPGVEISSENVEQTAC